MIFIRWPKAAGHVLITETSVFMEVLKSRLMLPVLMKIMRFCACSTA